MLVSNKAPEQETARSIVRRQMNRSGNILLSALEPLDDGEFYRGGSNGISAAWSVGHLACVSDLFTSWLGSGALSIARSTHKVFNDTGIGPNCAPTKAERVDRGAYSKADLLLLFRLAQVRSIEVLDGFDLTRWDTAPPANVPDSLPTCGAIWEHLAVHTYWHLGELAGSIERFYGTHTLNTVLHYFFNGQG